MSACLYLDIYLHLPLCVFILCYPLPLWFKIATFCQSLHSHQRQVGLFWKVWGLFVLIFLEVTKNGVKYNFHEMLQTHCICLGVLFFRLSSTSNQLWFGTVGSLCSVSRLSESQLSPRKDGLSRSGLNILSMGVRMEKFPFQLLSCTESVGIKLPTLPAHWEASFTGICKGKRESPTTFLPWQQRGPFGDVESEVVQAASPWLWTG